jgi:hypothetical protein
VQVGLGCRNGMHAFKCHACARICGCCLSGENGLCWGGVDGIISMNVSSRWGQ